VSFDPRAPHRATRTIVDLEGEAAVRGLYATFDANNRRFFGGKLEPPLLQVTPTAPRSRADYQHKDVHGLRTVIRLHPATIAMGLVFAHDILLHEMVHAWCGEVERATEDGYEGHGPVFAAKCNTIGEALGLGRVSPKGRGGLPNCSRWPVCVRPEGHYNTPAAELERAKCQGPRTRAAAAGADSVPAVAANDVGDADDDETPSAPRLRIRRPEDLAPDDLERATAVCLLLADHAEACAEPPKAARTLRCAARYLQARLRARPRA
jgi:hypothetical protein